MCVSSRNGVGMKEAVGAMFTERKGRDVYVLGSANVGKSTFIRAALKAMREQGNFFVPGKRLPTASAMPGGERVRVCVCVCVARESFFSFFLF